MRAIRLFLSVVVLATAAVHAQTYTESPLASFPTTTLQSMSLLQASDGNFYGITYGGCTTEALSVPARTRNAAKPDLATPAATIFRLTPAGVLKTLYTFPAAADADGVGCAGHSVDPVGPLVEGPSGLLYGLTNDGGATSYGSFFSFDVNTGTLTTLYSFCPAAGDVCPAGAYPVGGLILGSDGNFYGTASSFGDSNGGGTAALGGVVFKMTPAGVPTILHSFCSDESGDFCLDGALPFAALLESSDGYFYGTTNGGGPADNGVLYRVNASGSSYNVVYTFCSVGGSNCTDGSAPQAAVVEGSNGLFYGTTANGGANVGGVVYAATSGGKETVLHSFCTETDCADGYYPLGLYAATDGNIYGAASAGGGSAGNNENGSLFRVTAANAFSDIYTFCANGGSCDDGSSPTNIGPGSNGLLYGITSGGGTNGIGIVYTLASSTAFIAPVQLSLSASSYPAGSAVTLNYKIAAAYSLTLQQCYAYASTTSGGVTTLSALGKVSPTFSGGAASGTASVTAPGTAGAYTFGLTCGGTQSGTAPATITAAGAATTTSLTVAPTTLSVGQNATLTATVKKSSGSGVPTGTVTFSSDGVTIATANLNSSGVATITGSSANYVPGSYPVIATYNGDSNDSKSTSPAVNVTLTKDATATTVSVSPSSVTPPGNVTLTATVKRSAVTGTPGGSVTFYADGKALKTVGLNGSGVATFTASSNGVAAGNYSVTASYGGDGDDSGSTSAPVTVTVK